jgi:hypothetical protein
MSHDAIDNAGTGTDPPLEVPMSAVAELLSDCGRQEVVY